MADRHKLEFTIEASAASVRVQSTLALTSITQPAWFQADRSANNETACLQAE